MEAVQESRETREKSHEKETKERTETRERIFGLKRWNAALRFDLFGFLFGFLDRLRDRNRRDAPRGD